MEPPIENSDKILLPECNNNGTFNDNNFIEYSIRWQELFGDKIAWHATPGAEGDTFGLDASCYNIILKVPFNILDDNVIIEREKHQTEILTPLAMESNIFKAANGRVITKNYHDAIDYWEQLLGARIMPLLENCLSVDDLIQDAFDPSISPQNFTLENKLYLVEQLIEGYEILKKNNLITRDIKAANILISDNLELYFIDLDGITRQGESIPEWSPISASDEYTPKYNCPDEEDKENFTFIQTIFEIICIAKLKLDEIKYVSDNKQQQIKNYLDNDELYNLFISFLNLNENSTPNDCPTIDEIKNAMGLNKQTNLMMELDFTQILNIPNQNIKKQNIKNTVHNKMMEMDFSDMMNNIEQQNNKKTQNMDLNFEDLIDSNSTIQGGESAKQKKNKMKIILEKIDLIAYKYLHYIYTEIIIKQITKIKNKIYNLIKK